MSNFDPDAFLAGPAVAEDDFNPDQFLERNSAPNIGTNWDRLLGGLDGMDDRLGPEERATFQKLDAVSGNPKQARAQAINQAWVQDKFPEIAHSNLELNWPNIRTAYARQEFGMLDEDVTDIALYGAISKRHTDAITAQAISESSVGAWTWKDEAKADIRSTAANLEKFWESINKPAWELPRAPDNLPDVGGAGMFSPALAGAVWNGIAPIFESVAATPLGIVTAGAATPLSAAAKTYPVAKAALMGMEGGFAALMGWGTYEGAKKLPAVFNNPEATFQEKATKATEVVSSAAATLLGVLGFGLTAFEGKKQVQIVKKMEGKNAGEMADILRKEAEALEAVVDQNREAGKPATVEAANAKKLNAAADALEKLAPAEKPAEAKPEAKATELSPENKGVVQPLENGGYVVTDQQGKLIDYAETKAEAELIAKGEKPKGETAKEPTEAEVAAEGKKEVLAGIKNEAVDAELKAMGLEPATHGEKTTFAKEVESAAKKMKDDPEAGARLVKELEETGRPVTGAEDALLVHEMNRLRIERDSAEKALIEARNMGDTVALADAEARVAKSISDYQRAADTVTKVGTSTAQGLALRRIMLKEDYSLASMERQMTAANKGEKLAPEQSAEIKSLHERITAAESKLAEYLKTREAKAPKKESKILRVLGEQASAARERIAARLKEGRVQSGLDPQDLADHAIIGAEYLAKGVRDFAQWSEAMLKEFGERIKPHLQAIFDESKKAAKEEQRLESFKKRTEKRTTELKEKMESGDLEPAPKPDELHLDEEANRLKAELAATKLEFQAALERQRFEKMTPTEKAARVAADVYDSSRNIMTTGELSFIGRQGLFATAAHPIKAARSIPDMVRAFLASPTEAHALNLKTLNDPMAASARRAGVFLIEEGARLSKQEEAFLGRFANAKGIGGKAKTVFDWTVGRFNQAGTYFLNKLRLDSWKAMHEDGLTPAENKQLATYINEATGRGSLGKFEPSGVLLSRLLFAPRFLISRFQYAMGHSMWSGTMRSRQIIAKQYARTALGLSAYYTLMTLAFNEDENKMHIGTDPLSPDFGKIIIGKTRLDPLAGVSQAIVYTARTVNAAIKAIEREAYPEHRQELTKGPKWTDQTARFIRTKLHPVPGSVSNLFDGTDLAGQDTSVMGEAVKFGGPLTYLDIYDAFKTQDLDDATAIALLAVLGVGVQDYTKKSKAPATTKRE